jgi:hypothetical protein
MLRNEGARLMPQLLCICADKKGSRSTPTTARYHAVPRIKQRSDTMTLRLGPFEYTDTQLGYYIDQPSVMAVFGGKHSRNDGK